MFKGIRIGAAALLLGSVLIGGASAGAAPKAKCDATSAAEIEYYGAKWARPKSTVWVVTNEGAMPGQQNAPGTSTPDVLEAGEYQTVYGNGKLSGALDLLGVSCPSVAYRLTAQLPDGTALADITVAGDGITGSTQDAPFVLADNAAQSSAEKCIRVKFESVTSRGAVGDYAPEAGGFRDLCDDGGGGLPYLR